MPPFLEEPMICYICQAPFDGAGDCPGICRQSECRIAAVAPGTWEAFLAAKEAAIVAVMRDGPGRLYIHLSPREN